MLGRKLAQRLTSGQRDRGHDHLAAVARRHRRAGTSRSRLRRQRVSRRPHVLALRSRTWCRTALTSSSTSRPWYPERPRTTSRRATASTWTVCGRCSRKSVSAGTGYRPRVVFCSSIAVFGPPLPDLIGDEQRTTPATSYGTQKAIAELLLSDYSRRGFIDGIGLRLPTICVRPGRPNQAASGFFSSIIREPLNGEEATLPVPTDVRHWFASPRSGVGFLVHAAALDTALLGRHRCLTMPGVSATVATQIDALRRAAGDEAVALIRHEPDETIARIVATLAGRVRRAAGRRPGISRRDELRRHHPRPHRGRAERPLAAMTNSTPPD